MKTIFISLMVFFSGLTVAFSQEMIKSTFDSDYEEWTVAGGIMYYRDQGGNPGGFIEFEDDQDGAGVFVAPSVFLGDLSAYNLGTLSFDLVNTVNNGMDLLYNFGNVTITSPTHSASKNVVALAYYSKWTSFSMPFAAEEWGLSSSGWDSLLSDVIEIKVQVDAQWDYYDRSGIDNFTLVPLNFGIVSGIFPAGQSDLVLNPVYPNPVMGCAMISWNSPVSGVTILGIHDLSGRCIRTLLDTHRPKGSQEVKFSTEGISPGLYFCRLSVNGIIREQKMVVLE